MIFKRLESRFITNLETFSIILLFNLMICMDNNDFNYPFKLRLNNGEYLWLLKVYIFII